MSISDEIKQKTDIIEIIGQYTRLTKAGRTFRGICPFHSEKHPSFFVYPEQQSWHCFGACSTGGDVFSFLMKKEGFDFGEALRLLAGRAGVTVPSRSDREPGKDKKERLYQANEAAALYFHDSLLNSPAGEKARHYLARRGVLPKTTDDFQLGFSLNSWEALKQYLGEKGYTEEELSSAGLIVASEAGKVHDRFRNHLMFPILDIRGRVTGFGARVLDDSLPKYVNSPQTPLFDKSSILYGINLAASSIRQQQRAVIVEGYMDVIIAHQNGFSNVVASMGTSITETQVNTLKRMTRNLALALDADAAGEEAMLRAVAYESILGAEIKVIELPRDKDPDDVIKEDAKMWSQLVEKAMPLVDYHFKKITAGLDLSTARDKSLVADKLLSIIAEIKDVVRQAHYLQKLARLVKVSERNLEVALGKVRAGRNTAKQSRRDTAIQVLSSSPSSPLEEYCLALLLQHPELINRDEALQPEYFESTQNREVYIACQQANDLPVLKERLDPAIWEHLDGLAKKSIPAENIEQKYADCALSLRKKFLQNLEAKRAEVLASARETGGRAAERAIEEEQGIEVKDQLLKVFTQRSQGRLGTK